MSISGRNEGFHVLDEFVCEAIHASAIPLTNPARQGRNEGMVVVQELLFEAGKTPAPAGIEVAEIRNEQTSVAFENTIDSEVNRLAPILCNSADPIGAVERFQKLLLTEVISIKKLTTPS